MDKAQIRLLIVDDMITTQTAMGLIARVQGYASHTVSSVDEAWDYMQDNAVHLVLLDVYMPQLDGFVLLQKIRNDMRFEGLPVVMMSATHSDKNQRRATELGADTFLTQPISLMTLRKTLENLLH